MVCVRSGRTLTKRLRKPTRVANDADIQGAAVVAGKGLELVITLGTGVGTAFFYDGRLMPHLEIRTPSVPEGPDVQRTVRATTARKDVGNQRWNKRVRKAVATFRALSFFDHCYIGGGNAKKIHGSLGADVSLVDNTAGILGGIRLWERRTSPCSGAGEGVSRGTSSLIWGADPAHRRKGIAR